MALRARMQWCAMALGLAIPSCDSSTGVPEVQRRALEFMYVVHPGRTTPGTVVLRCGVLIGPDSCWTLESAHVRREGYKVIAEGTAIRGSGSDVCGQKARYDTLLLETPPLLEMTRYDLIAGDLTDDLWIHSEYQTVTRWLVARGGICPPLITTHNCYQFTPKYPSSCIASGWLVRDWPPLTGCISARLNAEILGRGYCVPHGEDNMLAVRRVVRL